MTILLLFNDHLFNYEDEGPNMLLLLFIIN